MSWESNDLVANWFENQMIWWAADLINTSALVVNWFENQVVWLSIDLRFKWFLLTCLLIGLSIKGFENSVGSWLPFQMKLWNSKTKRLYETSVVHTLRFRATKMSWYWEIFESDRTCMPSQIVAAATKKAAGACMRKVSESRFCHEVQRCFIRAGTSISEKISTPAMLDKSSSHHPACFDRRHRKLRNRNCLFWDHRLCNSIQVRPGAGTHQSVLRCFPCYIPASLDQVGYNRPDPPATSEKHVEVLHLFRWTTHTHWHHTAWRRTGWHHTGWRHTDWHSFFRFVLSKLGEVVNMWGYPVL